MNRSSNLVRAALLASFVGIGCSASDDVSSGASEGEGIGSDSTQATSAAPALGEPGAPGAAGAAGRDGHQRVFGDGSAGALEITKDTAFDDTMPEDGNLAFTSIHIAAGATLSVPSGTVLRATGNVDIDGKLVVQPFARNDRYGATGIAMPGRPACDGAKYHASGLSYEPRGGEGIGATGWRYGLPATGAMGGGSGCGYGLTSDGGGRITVASGASLTIGATGAIVDDGESAPAQADHRGGGGGGFIILGSASSVVVLGSLSARGGTPSSTIVSMDQTLFGGGGGGGGGILMFAPAVDTANASMSVAGGIAAPLPSLPNVYVQPYWTGGGGGGAVGDGGSGGFRDGYGEQVHAPKNGKPGAIFAQKTHPANSSLF